MRRLIFGKVFIGESWAAEMSDWFLRLKDAFVHGHQVGKGRTGVFFVKIETGIVVSHSAGDVCSHQTPPKTPWVQFDVDQGEIGQQSWNLGRFNIRP